MERGQIDESRHLTTYLKPAKQTQTSHSMQRRANPAKGGADSLPVGGQEGSSPNGLGSSYDGPERRKYTFL